VVACKDPRNRDKMSQSASYLCMTSYTGTKPNKVYTKGNGSTDTRGMQRETSTAGLGSKQSEESFRVYRV